MYAKEAKIKIISVNHKKKSRSRNNPPEGEKRDSKNRFSYAFPKRGSDTERTKKRRTGPLEIVSGRENVTKERGKSHSQKGTSRNSNEKKTGCLKKKAKGFQISQKKTW